MEASKQSPEDGFRESLKDLVAIAERLAPYCKTVEEMVGMAKHALDNEAQLRLLMATMKASGNR